MNLSSSHPVVASVDAADLSFWMQESRVTTNPSKLLYQGFQDVLSGEVVAPTPGRQHFAQLSEYDEPAISELGVVNTGEVLAKVHVVRFAMEVYYHEQISADRIAIGRSKAKNSNRIFVRHRQGSGRAHMENAEQSTLWDVGRLPTPPMEESQVANRPSHDVVKALNANELLQMIRQVTYNAAQLRQLQELKEFATREIRRLSGESTTTETVLEEFNGFVDQIEGDTAFVTLVSKSGEELWGEYSAIELAKAGIEENRRFKCQTVISDGVPEVRIESIPDIEISPSERAKVKNEITDLLSGGFLDGDE